MKHTLPVALITLNFVRRTVALRAALAACLLASPFAVCAADLPAKASWTDDFADATTLAKHWSSYGFLAAGIDAKNPLGKPVGANESRPEWWQIGDGALRGQNFPEEKHGSGISRDVSGKDVRLRCRFKIPAGGMAAIGIRGPNPILEKVFNVVSLHIRTDSIVAADNDVMHPKDSPEAAELKKKGGWNRKFYYAKTEKISLAPDAWHDLAVEVRGKELRVIIDAKPVLSYTTLCGDVPKTSIGFGVGGNGKTVMATWYDDVSIEPLDANK